MSKQHHLTPDTRNKIKDTLKSNPELSDTYIANQFGVSQTCVWYHRGQLGLQSARFYRDKQITQAWKENPDATITEVANECGVCPTKAWNVKVNMD